MSHTVNYVKAWAWHRHHEECPREKDRRALQGNVAYASAARRTYGGVGGGPGAFLNPRRPARVYVGAIACKLQPSRRQGFQCDDKTSIYRAH